MRIFYNYIILLIALLFFSVKVRSQQCTDFQLLNEPYPICSGESIYLSSDYYNSTGVNVDTSFQWSINGTLVSNSNNFDTILVNNTNNTLDFTINFRGEADGGSCVFDSTFSISVYPLPNVNIIIQDVSCFGDTNGSIEFILNNTNQIIYNANWQQVSTTHNNLPYGSYQYNIQENFGNFTCSIDTTIEINQPNVITKDSVKIIDDNCGQGTGKLVFFGLTGGTLPYSFFDSNSNQYYSYNDSIILGIAGSSTLKFITVSDANGCQYDLIPNGFYIDSNDYDVPDSPIYDSPYVLCVNDSLVLLDQESNNTGLKHYFSFTNGSLFKVTNNNPTVLYNVPIIFDTIQVKVEGKLGELNEGCFSNFTIVELEHIECEDSTSVENTVNAFSPNSSLVENSTFQIGLDYVYNEAIVDVKVKIYNRWGDVVNEFDNYNNSSNVWHGDNFNGEELPEGTYFYTVQIPSQSFSTSGWVYLDRTN